MAEILTYEGMALGAADLPRIDERRTFVERPKVIFNPHTKQFMMWIHLEQPGYHFSRAGIATSDSATGPFKFLQAIRALAKTWKRHLTPRARLCWPSRATETVLFLWPTAGIERACLIHVMFGCLSQSKQTEHLRFSGVTTGIFPLSRNLETNPINYEKRRAQVPVRAR